MITSLLSLHSELKALEHESKLTIGAEGFARLWSRKRTDTVEKLALLACGVVGTVAGIYWAKQCTNLPLCADLAAEPCAQADSKTACNETHPEWIAEGVLSAAIAGCVGYKLTVDCLTEGYYARVAGILQRNLGDMIGEELLHKIQHKTAELMGQWTLDQVEEYIKSEMKAYALKAKV